VIRVTRRKVGNGAPAGRDRPGKRAGMGGRAAQRRGLRHQRQSGPPRAQETVFNPVAGWESLC